MHLPIRRKLCKKFYCRAYPFGADCFILFSPCRTFSGKSLELQPFYDICDIFSGNKFQKMSQFLSEEAQKLMGNVSKQFKQAFVKDKVSFRILKSFHSPHPYSDYSVTVRNGRRVEKLCPLHLSNIEKYTLSVERWLFLHSPLKI